jgi:hypothetical protein
MFSRFGLVRVLARVQALAILLIAGAALAEDKEPFAILQLGGAENGASTTTAPASARQRRLNLIR